MSTPDFTPRRPTELAKLPLVLAAIEGTAVVVDHTFAPGGTVTVGSNSRNGLLLPPRFELTTYTLLTHGSVLHVSPPFYVQAWVWNGNEPLLLKGFWRDLRHAHPELGERIPLADTRFLVRYAGLALLGRYSEDAAPVLAS